MKAMFENTVAGSVGVFTYRLQEKRTKGKTMAVMWSVPFDNNIYANLFAMGLFDDRDADKSLYDEMYYSKLMDKFGRYHADNREQTYKNDDIIITCQMTNCGESNMKVHIGSVPANQGGLI